MVDSVNPNPPPGPAGPGQPAKEPAYKGQYQLSASDEKMLDRMLPGASEEDKHKFYDQMIKNMAQFMNTQAEHHKEHMKDAEEEGDSIIG